MTEKTFDDWLRCYQQAWMSLDAPAACALFTDDAEYFITPFDLPLRGQSELTNYWQGVVTTQKDVLFNYQRLSVNLFVGIAHWSAKFTRAKSGKRIALDGILMAEFDKQGRCKLFREWWHSQQIARMDEF